MGLGTKKIISDVSFQSINNSIPSDNKQNPSIKPLESSVNRTAKIAFESEVLSKIESEHDHKNIDYLKDIFRFQIKEDKQTLKSVIELTKEEIKKAHEEKALVQAKKIDGKWEIAAQDPNIIDPNQPIEIEREEGNERIENFNLRELANDEIHVLDTALKTYFIFLDTFPSVIKQNSIDKKNDTVKEKDAHSTNQSVKEKQSINVYILTDDEFIKKNIDHFIIKSDLSAYLAKKNIEENIKEEKKDAEKSAEKLQLAKEILVVVIKKESLNKENLNRANLSEEILSKINKIFKIEITHSNNTHHNVYLNGSGQISVK